MPDYQTPEGGKPAKIPDNAFAREALSERYVDYRNGPAAAASEARKWQEVMDNLDGYKAGDGPFPIKLYELSPGSQQKDYSYVGYGGKELVEANEMDAPEHKAQAATVWGGLAIKEYEKAVDEPGKMTGAERTKAANMLAKDINSQFLEDANNQLSYTKREIMRDALFPEGYKSEQEKFEQDGEAAQFMKFSEEAELAKIIKDPAERELFLKTSKAQRELNDNWAKIEPTADEKYSGSFIRDNKHILDVAAGRPEPLLAQLSLNNGLVQKPTG